MSIHQKDANFDLGRVPGDGGQARPARGRIRRAAAPLGVLGLAGAALAAWDHSPGAASLASSMLSLGLDSERSQVVVGVTGAALAAGTGGLASGRPLLSWAAGSFWYVLLAALPMALQPGLRLLPGEHVDTGAFIAAGAGLACLGFLPAGLGAAAGWGGRRGLAALFRLPRGPGRTRALALAFCLLAAPAAAGLWRASDILTYGPWSGVTAAAPVAGEGVSPMADVVFSYQSRVLGGVRQAVVILPPGYYSRPLRRYPVLYLLHGSPGSMWDWPKEGAGEIVQSLVATGRAPQMVVVSPDGVGPRGGAEDHWADGYVPGDMMETNFVDELIPAVESHFRVVGDRAHRAIGGLSSGGYGAANLALRHPGLFALAIDISGDLDPEPSAFGNPALRAANDPLLLALRPRPSGAAAFFVGWGDDIYAAGNRLFARLLQASGYRVFTASVTTAHSWQSFRALLWDGLSAGGSLIAPPELMPGGG